MTEAADDSRTYWDVAGLADTLVTQAVMSRDEKEITASLREAQRAYMVAFDLRSTVRERDSSLDHLRDLIDLIPSLAKPLDDLRTALEHYGADEDTVHAVTARPVQLFGF
jgi:hypothetical protein